LVDALVSVLMLSLGALSVMGASAMATRYAADRQQQTVASLLAQDLAERMRAHQGQAATDGSPASAFMAGAYDLTMAWQAQQAPLAGAPACHQASDICSPNDMAQADLLHWRQRLQASLPQGAAWVRREPASGMADIWVVWVGPGFGAASEAPADCPAGLALSAATSPSGSPANSPSFRCWHLRVMP
jgi:type IV pilus assembly protein PilV